MAGALGSDFDISDFASVSAADYQAMAPFLWPQSPHRRGGRFFGDGRFHTASGKARMVPVTAQMPQPVPADLPFRLNTGRVRDHWHTMTRTGLSPRLSRHLAEPFLELHPDDAARLGLAAASLAQLSSPQGGAVLRVLVTDRVAPGHPFAPIHWTGETAPTGRIDALVPSRVDPVSGQPASKSAAVAIRPFAADWYGFAVADREFRPDCAYWARAVLAGGQMAELAGQGAPDWVALAQDMFGLKAAPIAVHDRRRGLTRLAFLQGGRLRAALFVGPEPVALSRSHVAAALQGDCGAEILAGKPGGNRPDEGAVVCACFGVGVNTIAHAISTRGLVTVEAIGAALRAGTNCGSCRPELRALIDARAARIAAE